MKKFIKFFVAFGIFLLSAWKLKTELSSINFKDVFHVIQNRSFTSIAVLLLVSFLGVWILSLYDVVLIRSQKIKVPVLKTMKISWIINSLNTLIGFGGIIGSSIRYNYFQTYTKDEEDKQTLKKNISLLLLSMLTGIGVLSFLVLFNVFAPSSLLESKPILKTALFILAGLLPIFLGVTMIKPPVPSDRFLSLKYTFVSVLDYLFVGIVMFLSLRFVGVHVNFWQMESVFIIAAIAGLISMVPGGLGAFDVVFLLGMTQQFDVSKSSVLLALVFYRLAYYILPFFLGLVLSISELQLILKDKFTEKNEIVLFTKEFGTIVIDITKKRVQTLTRWAIIVLFLIGEFFFFQDSFFGLFYVSGKSTPFLYAIFSVTYILASTYLVPNLVGLYYGTKEAYRNLMFLLSLILISQIILFDELLYVEGLIFTLVLMVVLFLSRKNYTQYLTIRYRREKVIWLLTLAMLTFNVQSIYDTADAFKLDLFPGFLNYILGLSAIWFMFILFNRYRLRHKYTFSTLGFENQMSHERDDFENIITEFSGSNLANLGFLPANKVMVDKQLNVGCIYQETTYFVLILGDPVGEKDNFFPFIKNIHEYATKVGKEIIFYQTSTENIHIYTEFNYNLFNLGEEAEVDVTTFKISGNKGKVFRQLLNKQEQEELSFQVESPSDELINELAPISKEWLGSRKEMSFSLGSFDKEYLLKQDIATIRNKDGEAIAFASMMPTFTENEISIDLIRWKENEKIPMMDLLYLHLILWAKENDYQIFNLGMAPLSSSYERTNGLLGTITTSIYQHSSSLYSFKGLRQYKNKFKSEWSPRYLVYPRRLLISQALMKSYKVIHPK